MTDTIFENLSVAAIEPLDGGVARPPAARTARERPSESPSGR